MRIRLDKAGSDLICGVGSIVDAPTAAAFIGAGAAFVVSPTFSDEVARLCIRRRVVYLPGCATLTEIVRAEEAGCEIVKLFPAGTIGPEFVRAVLGPRPMTKLMPTGGIEASRVSVVEWIGAGAVAIGLGSQLIDRDALAGRALGSLAARVAELLGWVAEARQRPS